MENYSLEQLVGSLLHRNIDSPECVEMLKRFQYIENPHMGKPEFIMQNIIKAFIMQYFKDGETEKLLKYFGYRGSQEDGDPIDFLFNSVAMKTEEITEDNAFEEERKMIEEENNQ